MKKLFLLLALLVIPTDVHAETCNNATLLSKSTAFFVNYIQSGGITYQETMFGQVPGSTCNSGFYSGTSNYHQYMQADFWRAEYGKSCYSTGGGAFLVMESSSMWRPNGWQPFSKFKCSCPVAQNPAFNCTWYQ